MRNRLPEIDFHFSGERFCLFGLSVYMKKYDMTIRTLCARIKGQPDVTEGTAYAILFTISFAHLLNDMIQSVIPAIYPMIKDKFGFSFAQIGVITLVFQLTSSILQPFVGRYADRHPRPYALSLGMCFTLAGLLLLSFAYNFMLILLAVSIIGWGSFFIRRRRVWRSWLRVVKRVWHSLFSKWEEMAAVLSDLCWQP